MDGHGQGERESKAERRGEGMDGYNIQNSGVMKWRSGEGGRHCRFVGEWDGMERSGRWRVEELMQEIGVENSGGRALCR